MQHRTTLFSLAVLILLPLSAHAQSAGTSGAPNAAPDSAAAPVAAGPRADLVRAGFSLPSRDAFQSTANEIGSPPVVQAGRERGRTMMLVGGLVFLGGLLIGDDVGTAIAVTGLVIGVWGFYQLIR